MQHPNKYIKDNLHPVKDCHPIFDYQAHKVNMEHAATFPQSKACKIRGYGGQGEAKAPLGYKCKLQTIERRKKRKC